jgi:uncharacterized protein (DUF169 family)
MIISSDTCEGVHYQIFVADYRITEYMKKLIPMNKEDIFRMGQELKSILKLDSSPVAFTFIAPDEDIPDSVKRIDRVMRHCAMVDKARKDKEPFYALLQDQECNIGAFSLGMGARCNDVVSGKFYHSFGCFRSIEAAKRTMEQMPMLPAGSVKAVVCSALEQAPLVPDVVVIVAEPDRIMRLSQALLHEPGGRINASFATLQSMCVESVAQPYLQERVNISLGCTGSRVFGGLDKNEMAMGIPFNQMEAVLGSAKQMFRS